jgi:hypothetical protein
MCVFVCISRHSQHHKNSTFVLLTPYLNREKKKNTKEEETVACVFAFCVCLSGTWCSRRSTTCCYALHHVERGSGTSIGVQLEPLHHWWKARERRLSLSHS